MVLGLVPQVTVAAAAPPVHNPDADYMGSTLRTHEPSVVPKTTGFAALDVPPGVHGIDVSHWQGTMDWNREAAGGTR